jgi:hypothetical protein
MAELITIPDANAIDRDLITSYGQLTINQVRQHATAYIGTPTQNAQNSLILYKYLLNSLKEEAKLIMVAYESTYHINNEPVGSLFLKAIIGRASIDTKAKILLLRESVSHMYVKMNELKGDVREFNEHASDLVASLTGTRTNHAPIQGVQASPGCPVHSIH